MGFDPHAANVPGLPNSFTNNGTLQHEVWRGSLTPASNGAKRQVVALFNKGEDNETLKARAELIHEGSSGMERWKVRDVVAKKDLPVLAAGKDLEASVPRHGVALYILEQTV